MKSWRTRAVLVAAAALLFLSLMPDPIALAWPCQEDIRTFCKEVVPGSGRVDSCLKEHQDEISQECREARLGIKEKVRGAVDACAGDVMKFCKGVALGDARIARCMKEHEAELSPACRAQAKELKELMGRDSPCYGDQEEFCGDVVPGDGGVLDCMLEHRPDLSTGCNAHIEDTLLQVKEKVKERVQGFMADCRQDISKHCRGLPPGQGRIVGCLKEHKSELSDPCRGRLGP